MPELILCSDCNNPWPGPEDCKSCYEFGEHSIVIPGSLGRHDMKCKFHNSTIRTMHNLLNMRLYDTQHKENNSSSYCAYKHSGYNVIDLYMRYPYELEYHFPEHIETLKKYAILL